MDNKIFAKIAVALVLASLLIAPALAAEVAMDIFDADYDDTVTPGETVTLDFTLATDKDVNSIKVTGEMLGVDDTTVELKLNKISAGGQREHLKLQIPVPNDLKPGFYTLALAAEAKSSTGRAVSEQWTGNLEVEQTEHSTWIKSVVLSQETVTAGNTFDVAVRLLNNGENAEDGVRVKVEIPELDVSQTIKLTNTVFQEDEFATYITLNVPKDAEAGIYTVKVTASNSDFSATAKELVTVEAAPRPKPIAVMPIAPRTPLPVLKFGTGNVLDLSVSNNEDSEKRFTLQVSGVSDWTSAARVDPSTVTLQAGESATAHVYLLPTQRGEQELTMFVKAGSQVVSASDVAVRVDGAAVPVSASNNLGLSSQALVAAFVALVIIVAIAAAVWSMRRGQAGQAYY